MQIHLHIQPRTVITRGVIPLALLGLALALVMVVNLLATRPSLSAQQGVLALQGWQPERDHKVALAGEWMLFWDEFLSPDEYQQRKDTHPYFVRFPGIWSNLNYEGRSLPAQGKATVALDIALPESSEPYVLKIPSLTLDYRLWVNGEQKVRNEWLDDPVQTANADSQLRLVTITPEDNRLSLLFHVSNYRSKTGGIWETLTLAPATYRDELEQFAVTRDVVTSFLLCIGSVLLVIMAFREQRIAYIYLALWAAFMGLRAGTIEERLLFQFFDIVDFEVQRKLEYGILYFTVPFFALYLGHRFPRYFPRELHLITVAVMGALIALVVVTPATVYGQSVVIFQAFVVLYAFLWFGALAEFVREEPVSGSFLMAGSLIFIATTINDILFTNNLISGLNLSQIGALCFLACGYFLYLWEQRQKLLPEEGEAIVVSDTNSDQPRSKPGSVAYALEQFQQDPNSDHKRHLIALAMQYVLKQWESLGKDKLSLAEESGAWRITNDDGSLKTRTLDKYLKEAAIPKNPRTRAVIDTLNFVARYEGMEEEASQHLLQLSEALDKN